MQRWMVLAVVMSAACSGSDDTASDLGADLSVGDLARDQAVAAVGLGQACSADTQCNEGTSPVCFRQTLFNETSKLRTAQGYCSSTCDSDADCTDHGVCLSFSGESSKYCFLKCNGGDQCRTGYACFRYSGGYCFPSGNLNCDPTTGDGTCGNAPAMNPGGCIRAAWGTGTTGFCTDGCNVGAGSCPASGGSPRQCIVFNQTGTRDPGGVLTGDKFHGAICISSYSMNVEGQQCLYTRPGTTAPSDYIDACADGLECDLMQPFGGDNNCRQLCVDGADGGVVPVDGGAAGCPGGKTCTDVFGLFGTAKPFGLCR